MKPRKTKLIREYHELIDDIEKECDEYREQQMRLRTQTEDLDQELAKLDNQIKQAEENWNKQ